MIALVKYYMLTRTLGGSREHALRLAFIPFASGWIVPAGVLLAACAMVVARIIA